jgi:large subunit ribosomal protein L28
MARVCQVTGRKPIKGHKVSFSNKKALRRFLPNLQTKRFYFPEEDRFITLKLCTDAIKTISKNGLASVVKKMRAEGQSI